MLTLDEPCFIGRGSVIRVTAPEVKTSSFYWKVYRRELLSIPIDLAFAYLLPLLFTLIIENRRHQCWIFQQPMLDVSTQAASSFGAHKVDFTPSASCRIFQHGRQHRGQYVLSFSSVFFRVLKNHINSVLKISKSPVQCPVFSCSPAPLRNTHILFRSRW